MAIYKPSNFYPHLQEIDLTQENTFSCQVNTDGSMVSAARLTISSEDNILVYENLYEFTDDNGEKDPIENKGFMELFMDPYNIDNMISFGTKEEHSSDEVGNENISIVPDYTKIVIKNINFVTLTPLISYDERKNYCPYNIYNVKLKDSYCFGLKFVNKTDEYDTHLISFNTIDCEKTNSGYDITILYGSEIKFNGETIILENYNCYIVLLNNKDYTWDIKMYEHLFSEDIDKGTFITDGYVTGSTKSVLWWNEEVQTEDTLLKKKEIKEDYYIEINANHENSDLFEEQIKMGRTASGTLNRNNISEDKTKFLLDLNSVDVKEYKIDDIYLYVEFLGIDLSEAKVKNESYFKIKKIFKDDNYTNVYLEDLNFQNVIFDIIEANYNENNEVIDSNNISIKYYIVYKNREKITWTTENLGFSNNINKIEVKNDFEVNLKDGSCVDVYSGSNENTNFSFFGVRDSDLNINDIYVRFPGYNGLDFNGDQINDHGRYYNGIGEATTIYSANGELIDLDYSIGLEGDFFQVGEYIDANGDKIPWSEITAQSPSIYGKNVSYKRFENSMDEKAEFKAYIDYYNEKAEGTKYNFHTLTFLFLTMNSAMTNRSWITILGDTKYEISPPYERTNQSITINLNPQDGSWRVTLNSTPSEYSDKDYKWMVNGKYLNYDDAHSFTMNKITQIKCIKTGGNSIIKEWYDSSIVVETTDEWQKGKTLNVKTFKSSSSYYCKLFKVSSYDYETGEFVLAGGLQRTILNTDRYEVWERTVSETSTNEYNITEIDYQYTRIYPPHDKYDDVAYVGDTKILNNGIKIMNNNESQIFIQPNVNFYSDEYNYPYLILDNYNQRIEFPYQNKIYDDGFTIQDRTINVLDGSQWLLNYNNLLDIIPKPGQTYKLYMDTCKSTPSNWFYGRNIANIVMRVGEYNYIQNQIEKGYVKAIDFINFKESFNDITNKRIGKNCLVECVDAYFMATYDQLSVPIKRYRYKIYDSSMNLINDSGYVYDNHISYGVRGLRNEEIYLLHFEMEDQLGYVYNYEEKIIVKYIEYNTNLIQLQLTNNESQGCIIGDFVTMVELNLQKDENGKIPEGIIAERDTYDEDGNAIKKGELIKNGTVYAELCKQEDFVNKLSCSILDDIFVYRRNKEKLLSFVCKINLSTNQIITGREDHEHRYGFIDYGVYNNEYYDYVVILKQKDLTTDSHLGNMEYTYSESRCKTSFNGWILVDIEKDDNSNSYYVSDQVWNFKYNLESQDLTQNTVVSKWDTLGKYANVYIGQKNYMSSGLTCLLGDVGTYYSYNGKNFEENFGYFEQPLKNVDYDDIYNIIGQEILTNNIDKYLDWKKFNNNGNPKLLKDYKGNIWIVQILENPSVKNSDNSQEQIYTISFNWVEIMDWREFPILGKNINFDREEAAETAMKDILEPWDYKYDFGDMYYNLSKVRDDYAFNNVITYESPLLVYGRITLENNAMTGILNDSYLGDSLLESGKQFLSSMTDNEVENIYNSQSTFISPFKTKQLDNSYAYSSGLEYLDFEQSLLYENNSIDFLCYGMNSLKGININLTDAIKTARYAFAGTSISTDDQYQIQINTNNYINTYGMLDDLQGNGVVTVKWGALAEDPDLTTYAELYERYWNNDKIKFDCIYNFNIKDWEWGASVQNGFEDGVEFDGVIFLYKYLGELSSVYVPKFQKIKDANGIERIYLIDSSNLEE